MQQPQPYYLPTVMDRAFWTPAHKLMFSIAAISLGTYLVVWYTNIRERERMSGTTPTTTAADYETWVMPATPLTRSLYGANYLTLDPLPNCAS
jgi:hypothetical protein